VLGTDGLIDVALADAVEEGTIAGPHVLPAGHALSIPAGHSDRFTYPATIDLDAFYTPLQGFINSAADAEKAVHLQVKYGAKVIAPLTIERMLCMHERIGVARVGETCESMDGLLLTKVTKPGKKSPYCLTSKT
jgi:hypothetical protein